MRTRLLVITAVVVLGTASFAHAQFVVIDIIAWTKDIVLVGLQEAVKDLQQTINEATYIINRRLPSWTDVTGYAISRDHTPSWKIFDWFSDVVSPGTRPFHHTLSYGGDPTGDGFASIVLVRDDPGELWGGLSPVATAYLRTQMAGLDLTDAVLVRSADASGTVRFAGRDEDDAIALLQTDVLDPDEDQALNAVVSKLVAQSLIDGRNAQTALTLQTALVELLSLDAKREREASTAALNAQLTALQQPRDTTLDGTADLLAQWEFP